MSAHPLSAALRSVANNVRQDATKLPVGGDGDRRLALYLEIKNYEQAADALDEMQSRLDAAAAANAELAAEIERLTLWLEWIEAVEADRPACQDIEGLGHIAPGRIAASVFENIRSGKAGPVRRCKACKHEPGPLLQPKRAAEEGWVCMYSCPCKCHQARAALAPKETKENQ